MFNWVFVSALFALTAAAPQSYIVGPGHFHYEFGGQNEFKYATPTPAVNSVPVTTAAPIVKKVEYQVNPVTYRTPVTVRPITQQVTVTPYSQNSYTSQYSYPYQYNYPYGTQRYVSEVNVPQHKITVPQYNKINIPVATIRSQPVTSVVKVQQVQQPVPQVYTTQAQLGQNYGGYAILRYIVDINPEGNYNYAYETENGIKAEETGVLKNAGTQDEAEVAQGYYSYTGPDGVVYTVRYIADENGFRAEGDHLPKIPEVIQRSLEYLKTLPIQPDEQKK